MDLELVILGGGLAGCLAAHALSPYFKKTTIYEKSGKLCGNHTWCFHEGDVSRTESDWLRKLISQTWDRYHVAFPEFKKDFSSNYHAIRSEDLAELTQNLENVEVIFEAGKFSKNSNQITIDCTGWSGDYTPCGWQKFYGMDIELESSHGLDGVTLKDVLVEQNDGYRFFYLLPWTKTSLLVEDTYYSDTAELPGDKEKRIVDYIEADINAVYQSRPGYKYRAVSRY